MLRNFWYAVAASNRVRHAPVAVRVVGLDLVLFRQPNGEVACLSDRCCHRGDQLSRGDVVGDGIACPYHGWVFDKGGACTCIPSNPPDARIPARARADAWDVVERYGWIFVFVGDLPAEERPPMPEFPELEDPGWHAFDFEYHLDAHYTRVSENAIDLSHLPFLHRATYGPDQPVCCELLDHRSETFHGTGAYNHSARAPFPLGLFLRKPIPSHTTFTWHLPCFTSTRAVMDMGVVLLVMCHLPVDEGHTRILYRLTRNFARSGLLDGIFERTAMNIFREDKDSVVLQLPFEAPPDPEEEVNVLADALPLSLRKARRAALGRGWGVDRPGPSE